MTTLRRHAQDQVTALMNRGFLTRHAFEAVFNNPNGEIVHIVFRDNPEFKLIISLPRSPTNQGHPNWKLTTCPGNFLLVDESTYFADYASAHGQISAWLDRVMQEYVFSPNSFESATIHQMRNNLEKTADSLPDPDKPFTADELAEWSARFDAVLARIKDVEDKHKLQDSKVEELRKQLDALKEKGSVLPKRTWVKAAGNKVLDLLSSGAEEGVKALAKGAMNLLLGNGLGGE